MIIGEDNYFVSQREQIFFPDDSCHIACLTMLLKFINFSPLPSYGDLCVQLNVANQEGERYDFSLEEVVKFVVRSRINFRLIFRRDEWKDALKRAPIMVAMQGGRRFWGKEGHMIVLTHFEKNVFAYLDPWFTCFKQYKKSIDITTFYKHYIGFACQLLP